MTSRLRQPAYCPALERTLELTLALGKLVERSNASRDVEYRRQLQDQIERTREQVLAARYDVERMLDSAVCRQEQTMTGRLRRWRERLSDRVTDWLVRRA